MPQRNHRRQVVLFLIAIIVPALVLVVLSLRMISQERELAEKRLAEEQRQLVREISQELLARLERIKAQEVRALGAHAANKETTTYANPEVMLVSWIEENRLVLPWESNGAAREFQQLLTEAPFARRISQGEQRELADKVSGRVADSYRAAMLVAHHPAQVAYAELLLARALAKLGQRSEANAHYRKILAIPSEIRDEQGVPFALYAAGRLLEGGVEHSAVLDRIRPELNEQRLLSPTVAYILRELTNRLAGTASDTTVRETAQNLQQETSTVIRHLEQAMALQNDFSNLKLAHVRGDSTRNFEPLWVSYGQEIWLVSLSSPLAKLRPAVTAVRGEDVFASLDSAKSSSSNEAGRFQFLTGSGAQGELLGENFPGLKVSFAEKGDRLVPRGWNLQRAFYFVALLLVLSVTLFGGYLLWLDVRRESRLAEMRSQFVSSVSHELKTPLTAIRMFAETLRMGRSPDQHTQTEYLDTIINESERLTRLLDNVLDFSKIEQGKKTYHLVPTALGEVVRTAARSLAYPLAQQGFELRLDVEDNLPVVNADGDALQQAILNLLTNAMKYSGTSREIDLRLHRQNGQAVIKVTDYGVGIAREEQVPIFENFYRVLTPESKLIPGTGLGLTLVAHIVKAHGGRVEIESALGEGCTFSLHLPMETER
ncbi:MAG: sensor histidine kinase [Pyrinomonadaceae bacterium]